jgi:tricorn protease
MKKVLYSVLIILLFTTALPVSLFGAIDIKDTKFLSQPAIKNNHIAFVYAGDLWVADSDGKNVRRLTSEGGIPKRLTWHPGFDIVRGFTPDGSAVLFISPRNVFTRRYTQLFTVPIKGGFPESLKIPNAYKATYSPDGKRLAYNPLGERFRQWKNYRGGTVSTLWLYTFSDHSVVKIPQPEGRCNDIDPMWIGDKIYFLSDRNGEFNLFHYDINSKEINQLTNFADFPIIDASAGDNKIIFEQAGHLHIFDLATNQTKKLAIGVATDLSELRPRYLKGSRYIRSGWISPSGARAVIDFRGEIITVPAEKGDPRNLTNTPGVHERFPAWSPDGKTIAYFSDESGEYQIHLQQQDGKGEVKKYKLNGSGFYSYLDWSPDSKKLTFTDNARYLYWMDVETGAIKKIASEYIYQPGTFGSIRGIWSPDSKWIAYTVNTAAYIEKVYLYSIEKDKSYPVTDGLSDVSDPVFDQSGKYIYFFASTDAGPIKHWFAMSNRDMRMTRAIYLATLQKDVPSPLAKESDEEKGVEKRGI